LTYGIVFYVNYGCHLPAIPAPNQYLKPSEFSGKKEIPMGETITKPGPFLLVVGLFLLSITLMMLPSYELLVKPRGQAFDWFWIWVGGRAVLAGQNPYGPETTQTIQLGVFKKIIPPEEYQHGFPHPAHIAFVLLPFILLPFFWSVLLWLSLQIPLFMTSFFIGCRILNYTMRPYLLFLFILLTTLGFRYPINIYVLGQLTIFVIFCSLLAVWLFQRGHPQWAAVALTGTTIRPDLALIAILLAFILTRNSSRRNEFIATLLSAGFILAVLPMLFIGFWPLTWLQAILTYGNNPFATWPPELLPALWLRIVLLIGLTVWVGYYVLLAWRKPDTFHNSLLIGAAILYGLIVLPQTGSYTLTLALIPAMILWYLAGPLWLKVILAASLLMPWFYFALGGPFDRLIFLLIPGQLMIFQEMVRWFRN
jgi:hypothetical protein